MKSSPAGYSSKARSPTSLVAYQWLSMLLLLAIFVPLARKYKKLGIRSQKGFFNLMESLVEYVRDNIVIPNVGNGKECF